MCVCSKSEEEEEEEEEMEGGSSWAMVGERPKEKGADRAER